MEGAAVKSTEGKFDDELFQAMAVFVEDFQRISDEGPMDTARDRKIVRMAMSAFLSQYHLWKAHKS